MLSTLIRWSIRHRYLVILAAAVILIWILRVVSQMPVDVFPAFAPPQVEIQTEAPGLAPEEVESLVTLPIESAINGTPGVTTVRSASAVGLSVVKVIFNWNTDIFQARQLVTERLQQAQEKLPDGVESPQLSPISSPISTVVQYALTLTDDQKYTDSINSPQSDNKSSSKLNLMEVRRLVDWQITNRLLAVSGVSQVVVYGGDIRQYQVLVDPAKLKGYDVSLQAVTEAAEQANTNAPGGFLTNPDQEFLIRGVGRITSIEDLKESVITSRNGIPIRLKEVAEVRLGAALKRGDGWLNGKPAVVILINKQPQADTPTVTRNIEAAMAEVQAGLPEGVEIHNTFRQEDFIEASIENVREALIEGSIIVAIILIPFLMNWRALVVSLTALPLSLLLGLLSLNFLGQGLNTMTLGGLAVAIGNAVDDAIVDAENVYRCLRENRLSPHPRPALEVVFEGCQEVRDSLFGATLITGLVFSPVLALEGVEGRIFTPMGIAYLVVVLTSGLTALTVTPALCAILLPKGRLPTEETAIAQFFKRIYGSILKFVMSSAKIILAMAFASLIATIIIVPNLGRIFLPEFQERSLVNTLTLYPGVSLEATNRAGFAMQDSLKDDPRFDYIQLRSGRAPGDADAAGVNTAHLDVELSEKGIQDRPGSIEKIREEFAKLPGVAPNIGGFISHRMDEVLSGVRSAIAVKIFGPDLEELRQLGKQIEELMKTVNGIVDLQLEPQVPIQQIQIQFDRQQAGRYGLTVGAISNLIETALNGRVVSQVLEQQQTFDLLVWLPENARNNLETLGNLLIDTPAGQKIPLAQVANIDYSTGPNTINRENVSRLIVVSANASGRDLRSIVNEIQSKVKQQVQLSSDYFIQYGGQFESEQRATQNLIIFSLIAFAMISVLMYLSVKSVPSTAMIMINLPLGLVGGVISVAFTSGIISVASLVGFITLFGVAARNGLLLVDNYNTKFAEGLPIKEVITQGSMERLNAILMTAFTSALGLGPLVIGTGAGKEILQPLAIVVLGGLFTSTLLTLVVIPALYTQFGKLLFPKPKRDKNKAELSQEPGTFYQGSLSD